MFKATVKNSFLAFASAEEVAHRVRALTADFPALERQGPCGDDHLEFQLARLNSLMNQSIQPSVVCDTEELYGKWWCDATCDMQGAGFQCGFSSLKSSIPRIDSNSSVSTMVPDDTCSFGGLKQVASSSSISSLSDLDQEVSCSGENDQPTSLHEGSDSKLNNNSGTAQIRAVVSRPGQDFSHCHVPRHVNLAKDFAAGAFQSTHPTTIMIRNIPNRYSQHQIMKELEVLGFAGTFDFFYAPMDRSTKCTVGYAFVNFITAHDASRCWAAFDGFSGWGVQSDNVCEVVWSHEEQTVEEHVQRYRNCPLMHPSTPDVFRPALFADGVRVPFPLPTQPLLKPRGPWSSRHSKR